VCSGGLDHWITLGLCTGAARFCRAMVLLTIFWLSLDFDRALSAAVKDEFTMSNAQYGDYQFEIYFDGLDGRVPKYPVDYPSLERAAAGVLPSFVYSYVAGGCGDERTQRANVDAFSRYAIVPRMLVGATERGLPVSLFDMKLLTPLFLCPIGVIGLCAQDFRGEDTGPGLADVAAHQPAKAVDIFQMENRSTAAIFPEPEVERTRRGHRENGAHDPKLPFAQPRSGPPCAHRCRQIGAARGQIGAILGDRFEHDDVMLRARCRQSGFAAGKPGAQHMGLLTGRLQEGSVAKKRYTRGMSINEKKPGTAAGLLSN
jgi:hypothetical protein